MLLPGHRLHRDNPCQCILGRQFFSACFEAQVSLWCEGERKVVYQQWTCQRTREAESPDEPLITKVSGNTGWASTDQTPRTSGWNQSYLISMTL